MLRLLLMTLNPGDNRMTYVYDFETDPRVQAFLADGKYDNVDEWMADSDYVKVLGEWRRRDEDGGEIVDPEGCILGAIESVDSDPALGDLILDPIVEALGGEVFSRRGGEMMAVTTYRWPNTGSKIPDHVRQLALTMVGRFPGEVGGQGASAVILVVTRNGRVS